MKAIRNKAKFIKNKNVNVFIMMRYRDRDQFQKIENIIINTLNEYGLIASFAKDSTYEDDLWQNITFYMDNSEYGIVVFEEIDEREFNPNVSLELGYMYAKNKKCLLLKDKRMPKLPTDVCGKIYRNFDTYNLFTLKNQIVNWCEKDLQFNRKEKVIYDSKLFDKEFNDFWFFGRIEEPINFSIQKLKEDSNDLCIKIESENDESVGANINIKECLKGVAKFKYKTLDSSTKSTNLYYCLILMVGTMDEIIEYGSDKFFDPANVTSPYRKRYYVPDRHLKDKEWHEQTIEFDFSHLQTVTYCIFGIRINEGCPRKGKGALLTKDIKIVIP